ncbi:hypothetical protein [Haloterrigena alkaliphila]|uniref:Uncharacterized protein n=1 Tax=Haloterrigena alkaliphila TaxID=2816475 RepID=A0A8A2VHA5_9EURY|nr:hypothetical protein [Haloterrigena alkaliphila]QSX00048.1 hypothetical protein J0X25_03520 [Haloterrigena alkaliphila]
MNFTRRKALHICGSALLIPSTGCLFRNDSSETRLGEVSVLNRGERTYIINVLLIDDNGPVYWDSVNVEPSGEGGSSSGELSSGIPESKSSYTLYAWSGNQNRSEWEEQDLGEIDSACVNVLIIVGNGTDESQGDIDIRVSGDCSGNNE